MQNESNLSGDNVAQMPPSAPVKVQRGLATSSGQFTAIFSLVALILSFLGFHYSSEQVENTVTLINNVIVTLGPILAAVPVLMTYITSRGKITSNAIVTQGNIAASQFMSQDPMQVTGGTLTPLVSGIPGVGSFKDPHTYAVLLDIAKAIGVPEADRLSHINDSFHAEDVAHKIIGWFHKNKAPARGL